MGTRFLGQTLCETAKRRNANSQPPFLTLKIGLARANTHAPTVDGRPLAREQKHRPTGRRPNQTTLDGKRGGVTLATLL